MWILTLVALAAAPRTLEVAVDEALASTEAELRACFASVPEGEALVTLLHGELHVTVFPPAALPILDCVRTPLLAAIDLHGVFGPASAGVKPVAEGFAVWAGAVPDAPEQPRYVSRVVRRSEGALARCHRDYLGRGGTGARAEVTVWVSAAGDVTEAGVTRTELDDTAGACLTRVFRDMVFRPPRGTPATVVTWPLAFDG